MGRLYLYCIVSSFADDLSTRHVRTRLIYISDRPHVFLSPPIPQKLVSCVQKPSGKAGSIIIEIPQTAHLCFACSAGFRHSEAQFPQLYHHLVVASLNNESSA